MAAWQFTSNWTIAAQQFGSNWFYKLQYINTDIHTYTNLCMCRYVNAYAQTRKQGASCCCLSGLPVFAPAAIINSIIEVIFRHPLFPLAADNLRQSVGSVTADRLSKFSLIKL